ncbi:tRNA pseudouridine(38-40) synthase TruA [Helicobacter sp. 13S00401-1]|uniref:tRNA pseudouridine(38-40) synthase TruA n=1 Tax=Helicobacter sp. 13S00401-1 TaxID=1905758 RepID=UPI000BA5E69D|nr:tRNA pseudouridine(38-40) synthase TruA [Helicobacter sp. 13S00401-1]PAF51768.1 tRNA pseudouridine(38-40) synthase TruA [Helicobacter sp. 13S00401-1]
MHFLKCVLSIDGSEFLGSSKQPNNKGALNYLESKLAKVGITTPNIIASSRIDKGVHACFQVVRFEVPKLYKNLDSLKDLLNKKLYPYMLIHKLDEVDSSFHPRFSASSRTYRYVFSPTFIEPFYNRFVSILDFGDLDLAKKACKLFVGRHDFKSFSKSGSEVKDYEREIYRICIYKKKLFNMELFILSISANAFLRSQVRLIAKAISLASLGELSLEKLSLQIDNKFLLKECIRVLAPPNGLYLTRIHFKKDTLKNTAKRYFEDKTKCIKTT